MKFMPKAARRFVRKRGREYAAYLLRYTKSRPRKQLKVMIFAQGRTGSALLETLLASTGYFPANGELLDTQHGEIRFPERYLDGLTRWRSFLRKGNFLFHVKYYQLTSDRKETLDVGPFLQDLVEDDWRVIYLRRENVVKQALSNFFADATGVYHRFKDTNDTPAIHVDCDALVRRIHERIKWGELERKALEGLEYFEVVYEEDLAQPERHQKTVDSILAYLSLESAKARTSHRKVVGKDLPSAILNYEEVVSRLQEEGFHHYLQE